MAPDYPLPVMDLSSRGFLACLASAGRSHIGDYDAGARPRAPSDAQHRAWAAKPDATCLYCRAPDPPGGEEHVLSVALGNWFWMLPPGVVCARCNNGVLSVLDTALQRHPLIATVRVLANVPGRYGQPPRVGASNMRVAREEAGRLTVEVDRPRDAEQGEEELVLRPAWNNQSPRQRRDAARALLKLALGLIWMAKGPNETQQPKYDHVRAAIQDDGDVPLQGDSGTPGSRTTRFKRWSSRTTVFWASGSRSTTSASGSGPPPTALPVRPARSLRPMRSRTPRSAWDSLPPTRATTTLTKVCPGDSVRARGKYELECPRASASVDAAFPIADPSDPSHALFLRGALAPARSKPSIDSLLERLGRALVSVFPGHA